MNPDNALWWEGYNTAKEKYTLEIQRLQMLCSKEERQLRGIALMTDNATATHLLLVCDRLAKEQP